ncbi:MAG: phosphonate ABC transporter ATP-binding protein [Geminicoccaceae bacterium]|nr:MAG: phosphonate ABC transporter ATP-binding protein [Geminicoccaceae bacterium]
MLEIRDLGRTYGPVTALAGLDLTVRKGEFVGIIGRSGAGKSTLLRLINRLVEPTSGRIVFDGLDVTALRGAELRAWRRRAAMIFQQFHLIDRLDVITNVLVGRLSQVGRLRTWLLAFPPAERAMAVEALERLDMAERALQRADRLSGGQQQRVAIARALVQEPDLILADEPIASLDPLSARQVMEALARINREDGLTVLCNLHALDVARTYCSRVVGIAEGRLVFDGPVTGLDEATIRRIYGDEAAIPKDAPQDAAA